MKAPFAILTIIFAFNICAYSQAKDTISIRLSAFTQKRDSSEILFIAVSIKSNYPDSIIVDDTKSWIQCINAIGVKLIWESLRDNCYTEVGRSDCHPTYNETEILRTKTLGPFEEYSYLIEVKRVLYNASSGIKKSFYDFNPYRFKLLLPYKIGSNWSNTVSKNWIYFSYPR
jgi:hypothetical protein